MRIVRIPRNAYNSITYFNIDNLLFAWRGQRRHRAHATMHPPDHPSMQPYDPPSPGHWPGGMRGAVK